MYQFNPEMFNPQQLEAVLHGAGPMLVLAGAGSGKTRIIAHRVAHLVDVRGIAPDRIVAVSFTNKAARELKGRVAELIGAEKARLCHLSTFHALGADILRSHITRLGWQLPFAIIDTNEQLALIRDVLKEMHLQGSSFDPNVILSFVSRVKTAHRAPLDMPGMRWNRQGRTLAKIFEKYQSLCRSMNAVDFDDMIALPVELFEKYEDILAQYAEAWEYLLVDEYQDTNALQFRMLQLLCAKRANLMVVGDDDQSIYAFRGADSRHILEFPKLFDGVRVVSLEQNYRSTQVILDAANAVIAENAARHAKKLWSSVREGDKIRVFNCENPEEEAAFVVEQLEMQRVSKGLRYRDFAILYRTNPQSRVIEDVLFKRHLPYRVVGGSKYYDQAEIRELMFYLRAVYSFHDELAMRRIINIPRRGISGAVLEQIDSLAKTREITFFEAVKAELELDELKPAARLRLTEFVEIIERFHKRFMVKSEELSKTAGALISALHYIEYIQSTSNSNEDAARRRRANVDELIGALSEFERLHGRDLGSFIQQLVFEGPLKDDSENDEITLMTLHSAKGLEFPAVYIVGCEENLLPHANSLQEPALSEERRLFYVGITRAKKYLTITRVRNRRKMYEMLAVEPSRFLKDIPGSVITFEEAEESETAKQMREKQADVMRSRIQQIYKLLNNNG